MLHLAPNTHTEGARLLHPRSISLLNAHFAARPTEELLDYVFSGALGRIALVSSFGAEAAVLLHLAARVAPATPVFFLDTALLFPETLDYQRRLAAHLNLSDTRTLRADTTRADPENILHTTDPDACCTLRKTAPLDAALTGFDGWITGRKRFQSGRRATLDIFETAGPDGRIKINPLAHWTAADIARHFDTHALPRHPLVAQGYGSIGCAPCTTPTGPGEDPRAGRWRGTAKDECGLHIENGRLVRTQPQGATP